MADNVDIGKLQIVVEAEASAAQGAVKNLAQALAELKSALRGNTGASLKKLGDNLSSFASTVNKVDTTKIKEIADSFEKIKGTGAQTTRAMKNVSSAIGIPTKDGADTSTTSQTDAVKRKLTKLTDDTGESSEKATKKTNKFFESLKRIATYRAIRSALKAIAELFRNGIKSIYQWDRMVNGFDGTVSKAMLGFKTDTNFLSASLGANIMPLLVSLQPIFTDLVGALTDITYWFGRLFAFLGDGTYWEVNRDDVEKYTKAVEAAKSVTLGFDQLNIINDYQIPYKEVKGFGLGITDEVVAVGGAIAAFSALSKIIGGGGGILDLFGKKDDALDKQTGKTNAETVAVKGLAGNFGKLGSVLGGLLGGAGALYGLGKWTDLYGGSWGKDGVLVKGLEAIKKGAADARTSIEDFFTTLKNAPKLSATDTVSASTPAKSKDLDFGQKLKLWSMKAYADVSTFFANILTGGRASKIPLNSTPSIDDNPNTADGLGGTIIEWINDLFSGNLFAMGGFPEDGLFFANHGELVGQFANGKTAVANNDQIIAGISEGVYSAVVSAMSNKPQSQDINVYLDGRQIYKSVVKSKQEFGAQIGQTGLFASISR